jgi:hypothetical protein
VSTVTATCSCGSIGREDLRLCADHHRYWRGDKELVSVTKIIKSMWPAKPGFSSAPPDVLEHARERGIRVDRYFSEYLRDGSVRITAGEWEEVRALLKSLTDWWPDNIRTTSRPPQAQVILADGRVAGTPDIIWDGRISDLKTTYDIESTYPIQLGAYADLFEETYGIEPASLAIIHVNKRFREPKCIPLDVKECRNDWRILRDAWFMVQRRMA